MKKDYIILGLFLFAIFCFQKIETVMYQEELPLLGKIIYIDAGHGGRDPGALYGEIQEKDINLEISRFLMVELLKKGAIPYMTRDGDYDLASPYASEKKRSDLTARVKMIEGSGAELYLSVHLNSESNSAWQGAQVFYDDINSENKILAQTIQDVFQKKLSSKRQIKEISDLYLYRNTKTPGVLLEVGFLSNPHDRYLLKKESYQKKLAEVITDGVIEYYKKKNQL